MRRIFVAGEQENDRPSLARYGVALLGVTVALVLALLLEPYIGSNVFPIFLAAVMLAAYVGGFLPGCLAIVLATLFNTYFFLPPRFSLAVTELSTLVRLVVFTFAALLISSLTSARRRAEFAAKFERSQFESTLVSIGDGVITTDLQARVTFMNPSAEALTGWKLEDAMGQPLAAVFPIMSEETREPRENPAVRALREGVVVELANHTLLITKDGMERPIDDSGAPIRDANGHIHGAVLVFHDVSARRQARAEQSRLLAQAEAAQERFRATFEQAAVGIAHVAPDGHWIRVNQRLCDIVGYTREELLERTFQDITAPDDLAADVDLASQILAGAIPTYSMEKRYICKDGSLVWVNLTVSLVRYKDGQPNYFISVIEDIDARKQAEAQRDKLLVSEHAARTAAEHAAEQVRRLQHVTDAAIAHLGLDDLLQELLRRICAVLATDTATLLLRQPDNANILRVRAVEGWRDPILQQPVQIGEGFAGQIAAEREPMVITGMPGLAGERLREHGLHTLAGVPLISHDDVLGVIHVGTRRPRQFSADDIQLLQLVAERAAQAIERARLYEAEHRAVQRLHTLHVIDRAIIAAQPIERVAKMALERMAPLVPFQLGVVSIFQPSAAHEIELARHVAPGADDVAGIAGNIMALTPIDLHALTPPLMVDDLAAYPERRPQLERLLEHGVRSVLALPLQAVGERIGQLDVFAAQPHAFDAEHRAIVDEIGNQLAVALQQARYRQQRERHAEELEQHVAKRTADLQAAVDDLNTFTYTIAHDLRAPLRALQGFGTALLEDFATSVPEAGQLYLQHIVTAGEQMDQLIQDLLSYSRLSRADLQLGPVDLNAVVQEACGQLNEQINATRAEIDVEPDMPVVCGHFPTLVHVIENLLANGIKFVAPDQAPKLHVGAERHDSRVRLVVDDQGIGIGAADQERIFNVFERLHGVETYPGTGIGLAIVRKGVERMGGTSGVESLVGQGSRFWVELPAEETV